jgi:hypothetical protein
VAWSQSQRLLAGSYTLTPAQVGDIYNNSMAPWTL